MPQYDKREPFYCNLCGFHTKVQAFETYLSHSDLMGVEIEAVDVDIIPGRQLGFEVNPCRRLRIFMVDKNDGGSARAEGT